MTSSSNNKEPEKLYFEELNRNLKIFADYHKKESKSYNLQVVMPKLMEGADFMYTKSLQILGHEIIIHECRVFAALIAHSVKVYHIGGERRLVTCMELHVLDMKDGGK